MADIEKLGRALRNADAAASRGEPGAADDARALAKAYKAAKANQKQEQNVIATTQDGGRVIRGDRGNLSFVSPSYSTSDPDTIKRIMEGEGVRKVVQSGFDKQIIDANPIAARGNEFLRGVPFIGSYADEIVGKFSPKAAETMRMTTDAMQRERPKETMALNTGGAIAGSVPLAVAGAPSVMAAAPQSMAGRVVGGGLLGAIGGATEGAVYGYGEGQGESRRDEATRQAQVGGAIGGGLGVALPFAGPVVEGLARRWKGEDVSAIARQFQVSKDTARVLKKAFANNDTDAAGRLMRAGDEATMADAGRSGQSLMDAAAQTGGRPLNIVDSAVTARANRTMPTVNNALDEALGPVQGPREAARRVAQESAPARAAAYGQAKNTPINYAAPEGQAIEKLVQRIDPADLRSATEIANKRLRWDGGQKQIMIDVADNGSVSFREKPGVAQLDELKKALNQVDQNNRDVFGRSTDGGLAGQQANAVRDATVRATGGTDGPYARALRIGGDKIEQDRALEFGLKMLRNTDKTTKEMAKEMTQELSSDGRAMMKVGVRSYIDDLMGRVKDIASDTDAEGARQALAALKELSSDNAKAKLRLVLGANDFNRLMPQLDKAMASQGMKASVAQNSKTAIRQAVQGEVMDVTTPGTLGTLARGEPIDATRRLTQELLNTTPAADAARTEQIWSEVAEVLSKRRGNKSAEAALRYVEQAIAGNPLTEAQARLVANQAILGANVAGSRTGNQSLSPAR